MSDIDLEKDGRLMRVLLALSAAFLLAVLALAWRLESSRTWREQQESFNEKHAASFDEGVAVRQHASSDGGVDRCITCHLGIEREDLAVTEIPLPFRAHGPGLGRHDPKKVGCTSCHGGNGRALDIAASHASADLGILDPLMKKPHIQASCSRCHIPGDKPGQERLVEGANLYAGLGCPVCHPLTERGLGGMDFGPDLRDIGRKTPEYLKTSLLEPARNFEGSTMPSFRRSFEENPRGLESLIIYLESLALRRQSECRDRDRSRMLALAPCRTCHAGADGKSSGGAAHRCPYILDRKSELRCSNCHEGAAPGPGARNGYCPLISQHREACDVCHEGGKEKTR